MSIRLIASVLLCTGMIFSSCKTKNEVVIPKKDRVVTSKKDKVIIPEQSDNQKSYEQALKDHWAMQSEETKAIFMRNQAKSELFNSPRRRKGKTKACSNCNYNESVVSDGVRDIR